MRRQLPLLLILGALLLRCASGQTEDVPKADVEVRLLGTTFFGSGMSGPVPLEFTITNREAEPVTVRSIRVSSPGMGSYTLRPEERLFQQTIAAGEMKTFPFSATAITGTSRLSSSEPLSLRAEIDFHIRDRRARRILFFPRVEQ